MRRVYLDHQATTPLDPAVAEAMSPYLRDVFGNPASAHVFGEEAREAVDDARSRIAQAIGASAGEIFFTSGATESNNLALQGVICDPLRNRVVTSAIEHKSVLDTARFLSARGVSINVAPATSDGFVNVAALSEMLDSETTLLSVMFVNNEVGTVQPIREIFILARERGIITHSDATQALGVVPIDVDELGVDMLSLSAHKIYGPKGVGVLYVRSTVRDRISPLFHGGDHEGGLRSGTVNVPGCAGMAEAAQVAVGNQDAHARRLQLLRDRLWRNLQDGVPDAVLNGHPTLRHPSNLSITFPGVPAEALAIAVPEVAFSQGSACSSATPAPSHVLQAMGLEHAEAESTIRLSVGRFTSEADVDYAGERLVNGVVQVRHRMTAGVGT